MCKLKIISNPYKKDIQFQTFDKMNNEWITLNHEENTNSKLLSNEIVTGFFPFKVKKIVDTIINEYCNGDEKIDIVFEGTDDEYDELKQLCLDDHYEDLVTLTQSTLLLENARDILPKIKGMFQDIRNLVYDSVSDKTQVDIEFNRLTEASDDIIPLCVLGNYSCGKSTFINSLIGYEILPSGADPVTAKVFKISKSRFSDRASVSFEFDSNLITISFMENKYKIDGEISNQDLLEEITDVLDDYIDERLDVRVYNLLDMINTFEDDMMNLISDLINVCIPFRTGIWTETDNNFVIFDTPGSNSASNEAHLTVLKKALSELSNGIIIFISKYDTLDSIDNENLYLEINSMKELDSRFTMIVVNQADSAEIPKNHERKILRQAVPKKLHSDNILFVSSIMGLGTKNDNNFINEHCAEVYDEKYLKYNDPETKFYKQLYKYNIMPEQLKKKAIEQSDLCKDKVYANSGLYCIEDGIQTFANKYSSYNKCQQSLMFLRKISKITSDQIEYTKDQMIKTKEDFEKSLEKDKVILKQRVEGKATELLNRYKDSYQSSVMDGVKNIQCYLNIEELNQLEKDFINQEGEKREIGEKSKVTKKLIRTIKDDFLEDAEKIVKNIDFNKESIQNIKNDLKNMSYDTKNNFIDLKNNATDTYYTRKDVIKYGSDNLLSYIKSAFKTNISLIRNSIDLESKNYWEDKVQKIKNELSKLIADSEELCEEKREELSKIIIMYDNIVFEKDVDDIFQKEYLTDKFKMDRLFFGESLRLDKKKLQSTFNNQMNEAMSNLFTVFNTSHATSFESWLNDLLMIINENIVEYSPTLHRQLVLINSLNNQILDLESKKNKLSIYDEQLEEMMSWKVN